MTGSWDADVAKCKLDLHCDQRILFWISGFSNCLQRAVCIFGGPNYPTKMDVQEASLPLRLITRALAERRIRGASRRFRTRIFKPVDEKVTEILWSRMSSAVCQENFVF